MFKYNIYIEKHTHCKGTVQWMYIGWTHPPNSTSQETVHYQVKNSFVPLWDMTLSPVQSFISWFLVAQLKKICLQCRRQRRLWFNPWVRKIPWRRKRQPTPVFLPGKCHEQKSLACYRPWGCKRWHVWSDWACNTRDLSCQSLHFI